MCRWIQGLFVGVAIVSSATIATAQEALRTSMAGQAAAEAKKAALANEKFNIEWGPISLRTYSSLQTEATDNVRLTRDDRVADLVFRPQVNVLGAWQVSEKNRLTLSVGAGYSKYVKTTEYDRMFLTPNSDLSFDIYVKDFKINFHDRFKYSQDVSSDPTISGIGSLSRLENYSGVGVEWDLNKAILGISYDHVISLTQEKAYSYQNLSEELFNASAGFEINPFTLAGVEIGGGFNNFEENILRDNQHISAGPFLSTRLSEYSQLRMSVGYVIYFFDEGGASTNTIGGTVNGLYADLSFRQRLNASLSHSLSVGRQLQSGLFSDTLDVIYVRHTAQWRVFRKTSLTTSLSYEHTSETGIRGENSSRYGFGIILSRPWSEHIRSSLSYQFYLKKADPTTGDYLQNRLVLDLGYAF